MPKIKITESTIHMFSELEGMLGEREFRDNINMQLKDYDLTPEFVSKFREYIDVSKLSGTSLSPEMIKALGKDFDFVTWNTKNDFGNHKNIDILLDDQFYAEHKDDCEQILQTTKSVSQKIFQKYFDASTDPIKANFLLNYDGPEVTRDSVMKCIGALGARFFEVPFVKRNILTDEKEIQKVLDSVGVFNVDMPFIMTLMIESYCPNEIANSIEHIVIKDTSSDDITKSGNLTKYTSMVHEIIQKYPNKVLDIFMPILYQHMPDVLKNQMLLKEYLVYCDNIAESTLISLFSEYLLQGLHDELVAYALNYKYESLLMVIKLGA
jgi:hypothetical protein